MACHYFKKGYFGVCTASELSHVPSIAEMEHYCFREYYRICPIFEDFMTKRTQSCEAEKRDFAYIRR
jgi:hypothetical protein